MPTNTASVDETNVTELSSPLDKTQYTSHLDIFDHDFNELMMMIVNNLNL